MQWQFNFYIQKKKRKWLTQKSRYAGTFYRGRKRNINYSRTLMSFKLILNQKLKNTIIHYLNKVYSFIKHRFASYQLKRHQDKKTFKILTFNNVLRPIWGILRKVYVLKRLYNILLPSWPIFIMQSVIIGHKMFTQLASQIVFKKLQLTPPPCPLATMSRTLRRTTTYHYIPLI